MKKEVLKNGITLISLVITIIILLILASVAISLAVNADGLFPRAEYAKDSWNNRVAEEETELQGLMDKINEYAPEEGTEEGTKLIDLYKAGELKIGDYVNYNPIAEGDTGEEAKYTYTSYGTKNGMGTGTEEAGIRPMDAVGPSPDTDETGNQIYKVNASMKWRVLGTEGEGVNEHLLLISEEPIAKDNPNGNPFFWMKGAIGYLNGIDELNNIGKIYGYGEGATGARSVNINDINKISGVTVDERNYKITPEGIAGGGKYGHNYSFEEHYTPENWKGSKETSTPETVAVKSTYYYYSGDNEQLQTNTTKNPETGDILHTMIYGRNDSFEYWLASRGYSGNASSVSFWLGGVKSGKTYSGLWPLFHSTGDDVDNYRQCAPCSFSKS